jgi:phosphatidylethanolamine/phosphatidyl-N-methylethanolamine N-methyltransferase
MRTKFFRNYVTRPNQVGAVAPSSKALCQMIVDVFDWETIRYAVEYGPGTGAATPLILQSLHPDAKFFAIERNAEFCQVLRKRLHQVDLCEDSVENVVEHCRVRGFPHLDAVVSGLPWASFSEGLQVSCLDSMAQVLKPGGQFATFAYLQGLLLPAAKRFRKQLENYFSKVTISPTVWLNLPPAFVYRCVR